MKQGYEIFSVNKFNPKFLLNNLGIIFTLPSIWNKFCSTYQCRSCKDLWVSVTTKQWGGQKKNFFLIIYSKIYTEYHSNLLFYLL